MHARSAVRVLLGSCLFLVACSGKSGGPGSSGGDGGNPPPAWAAGIVGPQGLFLATDDYVHFTVRPSATANDLHALVCVGHTLGWAAGAKGTIVATVDGGVTWITQSVPTLSTLRGISFGTANDGIAVGDSSTLLSTGDGGHTWSALPSPAGADFTSAYASRVSTQAWAVGSAGTILRSADGGRSFSQVHAGGAALRGVKFWDAKHGYAVGDGGTVLASTDGGLSWTPLASAPADLRGLAVSDDGMRIVAVGALGTIWRSADSGATWGQIASGTSRRLNAIGFLDVDPNQGWAAGEAGTVLYTSDAGAHWAAVAVPVAFDLESVEDL